MKKAEGISKKNHSSYWMDQFDVDFSDSRFQGIYTRSEIDAKRKFQLSSAKKAISNFVSITTGKPIPVRFATNGDQSYTDGKSVVLSGDIDDSSKFDVAVGLALHEGSHVLLSDFEILKNIYNHIPLTTRGKATQKGIEEWYLTEVIKTVHNIVEDRRIDAFIYKNAPGYREYYQKLYDHYFGSPIINEALRLEWKEETIQNYLNRLVNIVNPTSTLSALKGLRKIWEILDINNIDRLKNSRDSLTVAFRIVDVILDSIPSTLGQKQDNSGNSQDSSDGKKDQKSNGGTGGGQSNQDESSDEDGESDSDDGDGESDSDGDTDSDGESDGDGGDSTNGNTEAAGDESEDEASGNSVQSSANGGKETDTTSSADSKPDRLSKNKLKNLEKILKKQTEFLSGETSKKRISSEMNSAIQAVDSDGSELIHTGNDYSDGDVKGWDVVLIKNLTKEILKKGEVSIAEVRLGEIIQQLSDVEVAEAEQKGTMLGKRLQIRNESRTTTYNRQRHGKIDKRMIHSLGFGAETVFSQIFVDKYRKANIHLTVDASGSMNGPKWKNSMKLALSLAKAVSMIQNLSIQVSVRYGDSSYPYIVMVYDSRKDKYQKAKSLIPLLRTTGSTPEGLTFEALEKLLVPATSDTDSYFVNISDGEPMFGYFTKSGSPVKNQNAPYHKHSDNNPVNKRISNFLNEFITMILH